MMSHHRRIDRLLILSSFAAAIVSPIICRAADAPQRQYVREIKTDPRTREELLAVRLDSDVYAASHENYYDLQVVDAAGQTVPFVIRQPADTKTREIQKSWLAENPSLKVLDDEALEITVQLDKDDPRPDGVKIVTPLRNFEQRVQVFGLTDGQPDQPLVTDALIFDYARYMDVRQHDVRIPATSHRRFRVVIDRPTSVQASQLLELSRQFRGEEEVGRNEQSTIERRPFRIDRVEFFEVQYLAISDRSQSMVYPVVDFEVKLDEEEKQTLIEITSRREPLNEFAIVTPSRNFSRPVRVQIPELRRLQTEWDDVEQATISHLEFRDLKKEHLTISFPVQRQEKYRLVVDNGDNAPLKIHAIGSSGSINELIFLASPATSYRLKYGVKPDAEPLPAPSYDTATIQASLAKNIKPLPATLGPQEPASPSEEPARFNLKSAINNPWVLGALVIVLVAILGCGLYFAGRRFEQMPRDGQV